MKIIMGIDSQECLKTVADLPASLGFAAASIELAHVLERLDSSGLPRMEGARADILARYLKMQEDEAKALLEQGQTELKRRGLACTVKLLTGFSANRLVDYAEESKADLLALGSSGKGRLESAITGSVGRKALIAAKCSVLISKKELPQSRPIKVVIATDHSKYANDCLQRFISWRPQGISEAVVVTVFPEQLLKAVASVMEHFKADVASWVKDELGRANNELIKKFAPLKTTFRSRVEPGPVGDILEKVMIEENADLLVLGAQGHGFVERLTVGSVSLDQATRRPYSVLVLRC